VQVHHNEGVAIHIGPESCAGGREAASETLTEGGVCCCHQNRLVLKNGWATMPSTAGTVKLSEKDESILGLGLDQASLAIPVTSAQT
jgi:hypothetical protein